MKKIFLYACAIIVMTLQVSCSNSEKEIVIKPGEGIHHDDFEYIVENFVVTKKVSQEEPASTSSNFYIIKFKVENNAIRVNHSWNNSVAYVIDESGTVYENKPDLQAQLTKVTPFGLQDEYTTEYQSTDTTYFVFELPDRAKKPYLMVRGETLMGDFFDGNQFEKTKVKLF